MMTSRPIQPKQAFWLFDPRFAAVLGLTVLLAACGGGGGGGGGGVTVPPYLNLTVTPASIVTYPSSSFTLNVSASTNASATPTVTLGTLPTGISTTATFPLSVPSSGASITFETAATLAAGTFTIVVNGEAGSATASASIAGSVQTNPPAFSFVTPFSLELSVSAGGSGQIQFDTQANGQAYYDVQLSVSGLPPGTTASVSPQAITPGQSTTVSVTASSSAPPSQNTSVTLTGTPSAQVSPASITFLLDVTPAGGLLPDNRTDYVATDDTPYAAVYDSTHGLIFASNPSWNRVEVISATTHAIVNRIPIREPRGIDISQDSSTVWVGSGSRQVFSINTTSFTVARYLLPQGSISYWENFQVLSLADGTLMLVLDSGYDTGAVGVVIWDPSSNGLTFLSSPSPNGWSVPAFRSGDGEHVFFFDGGAGTFSYDVESKTFGKVVALGGWGTPMAVNNDGSRVAICGANGPYMYDGSFNPIGPLPVCAYNLGVGGAPFFQGGSVFSTDGQFLYQSVLANVPLVIKVDANTLNVVSTSPAMPMIPVMVELSPPYYVANPFAADNTGMVYGIQYWGIALDDGAYPQIYSDDQLGTPIYMQHMDPYFGPLSGGTTSSEFSGIPMAPTVWYGSTRGTATLLSASGYGDFTITSPPSATPGPVNIKMLFPDGVEVFDPLFFCYGSFLQQALISGAPPQGNVAGQVTGYGLPGDDGLSGTLTVGGSAASIQPPGQFGLPFAGQNPYGPAYPSKVLSYTVPPGNPGWADITLSTPDGTSTLPKALFYAKSVTDYSSTDTFAGILYDGTRQQLYLSAGDHIDVFSLASNEFVSPLKPPATGSTRQFTGMALTPDGSLLLAADLMDGSLAAISPDNPSNNFAIPIAAVSGGPCYNGPLYVAATSNNEALVVTGGIPAIGCGPGGSLYLANLATRSAGPMPPPASGSCNLSVAAYVAGTNDGSKIAIGSNEVGSGFCIYDPVANAFVSNSAGPGFTYGTPYSYGLAFSGDGQVAAFDLIFMDEAADVIGRVAKPDIYYSGIETIASSIQPVFQPQLNASGSLYFMAFPNFVEIIDVLHAFLRMRFSLSETVSNTAAPAAVDPGGRFIYLITNMGLTIVDLGEAPLSIGWISPSTASAGAQVQIRGSGFDSSTTATVGGQAAAVSVTDENTLTLTVPNINSGPATITLTNSAGISYSAAGLLTVQ